MEGIKIINDKVVEIEKLHNDKALLEEDSKVKFSKYSTFYKAFVKLDGEKLRKIYVTLDKLNITTLLITSIKNKFNKSDIDEMQKLIDNEAIKLKLYSDEEIKFKLYYKLMKLCNISNGCLASDKEFKGNLDKFVECAYSILVKKKNFKSGDNALEDINAYYMNEIIFNFEKKYNDANEDIKRELIDNIYNNFEKLPEDQKKRLYDKLNIKNVSADAVKASMKTMGPTFILSFLTGPFMIVLLLADGFLEYGQGKKQKIDLVPIIIMQICVSEISLKNDNNCEEKYYELVRGWKEKRNDFEINNNIKIKITQEINELNENKSNLEKECSKETKVLESLSLKFQQEKECFKYTLLISPKRSSLKNYPEFEEYSSKLKTLTYKRSTNKGLGFFSKIVSKVKDRTKEFMIKKKINELESILILEGTQSELFNSDTINLKQIEKDLVEKNITIINLKGKIEEERKRIIISNGKLANAENIMKNIKGEFFDIDFIR